jgi:hypothetical protein
MWVGSGVGYIAYKYRKPPWYMKDERQEPIVGDMNLMAAIMLLLVLGMRWFHTGC